LPSRRPKAPRNNASPRTGFRKRYDELEARRTNLIARLNAIAGSAERHPGYKRALTLLNHTFRKSKLAQRLAILQAAAWLIDVLEKLTTIS
jgi:predicted metal-dependent HD superfamily phosphohydrolase